jgi:hypothetical protein
MSLTSLASRVLGHEARSLLTRLARVRSFALTETSVPAAALSPAAQISIERALVKGRREVRADVLEYLRWLEEPAGQGAAPHEIQRRYTFLRLRFNAVLTHLDIYAQVLTQRSEHETGVWLAGLDAVAADALALPGGYYDAPPIICYLDRGFGAAIRRARTRLPGGGVNPVGIVRVPRERMVGTGIGASLIHEVGHQGAALLDLNRSLREEIHRTLHPAAERPAWTLWERWISEIVADFWAMANLGIGASLGLLSVVSLPSVFVFRSNDGDPHPTPWIRVKLSCAMGRALFPHPQWDQVVELWEALYPPDDLDGEQRRTLAMLEATIPRFVEALVAHRPASLKGRSLREVMPIAERQPAALSALFRAWRRSPARMFHERPTLVFAVLGQARADGQLSPEDESRAMSALLTHWALHTALQVSADCAALAPGKVA